MSLNKISIYIETNIKIEYRKYTIYKATLFFVIFCYLLFNASLFSLCFPKRKKRKAPELPI